MESDKDWRVIVVGGHTRSIGKTQLVCDLIAAFPEANWVAGKITQYGHGVCAQKGADCNCAPDEHVCAISWETQADSGTDSARFLAAGARRSFWLRTKQGYLAEGLPLLRAALHQSQLVESAALGNLIVESNTLLQFWRPLAYFVVLDPTKADFKQSARLQLDRASSFVLRQPLVEAGAKTSWTDFPRQLLEQKPQFLQREGEPLPSELLEWMRSALR
jgi:hypothetical protein